MQLAKPDPLCVGGQGLIAGLKRQVQVIGHQAEGVHAVAEACHALRHQFIEAAPIIRGEEDLLPGVTAQDHVIEAAGHVQSRFAGHVASVAKGRPLCN
jgi:hypothetical protein